MTVEMWTRGSDANAAAWTSTEEPAATDGGREGASVDGLLEGKVEIASGGAMCCW